MQLQLSITIVICLSLVACTTSPAKRFDSYASKVHLVKTTVDSSISDISIYGKKPLSSLKTKPNLHIYIEGDGTPWITNNHISNDPTPRQLTTLELMLSDPYPAMYLGRPCYHLTQRSSPCDSKWWTSHRYSQEVISSLINVITKTTSEHQSLTLIGFSGGGTLAMLMAANLSNVEKVITISGNLDVDHWTKKHKYSHLYGSLNPATKKNLEASTLQYHLLGSADENIDANHIKDTFEARASTQVHIFSNYTHHCCWKNIWPETITNIVEENSIVGITPPQ